MRFRARRHGRGTAELPGYGIADAEHRLEKELTALHPVATLQIRQVRRIDPEPRVVETFALNFTIALDLEVDAEGETDARRKAFAAARNVLMGSRFERVGWERVDLLGS